MGDLAARARNQFVHIGVCVGKQEHGNNYIKWMQQYAEQSLLILLYLYKNRKTWRNEGALNIFFDNYQRSEIELMLIKSTFDMKKEKGNKTVE